MSFYTRRFRALADAQMLAAIPSPTDAETIGAHLTGNQSPSESVRLHKLLQRTNDGSRLCGIKIKKQQDRNTRWHDPRYELGHDPSHVNFEPPRMYAGRYARKAP